MLETDEVGPLLNSIVSTMKNALTNTAKDKPRDDEPEDGDLLAGNSEYGSYGSGQEDEEGESAIIEGNAHYSGQFWHAT